MKKNMFSGYHPHLTPPTKPGMLAAKESLSLVIGSDSLGIWNVILPRLGVFTK